MCQLALAGITDKGNAPLLTFVPDSFIHSAVNKQGTRAFSFYQFHRSCELDCFVIGMALRPVIPDKQR